MSFNFITRLLGKPREAGSSQLDNAPSPLTYESVYRSEPGEAKDLAPRCSQCCNAVKLSNARFCLAHPQRFGGHIFFNDCLSNGKSVS